MGTDPVNLNRGTGSCLKALPDSLFCIFSVRIRRSQAGTVKAGAIAKYLAQNMGSAGKGVLAVLKKKGSPAFSGDKACPLLIKRTRCHGRSLAGTYCMRLSVAKKPAQAKAGITSNNKACLHAPVPYAEPGLSQGHQP